jgi:hypothetical protein
MKDYASLIVAFVILVALVQMLRTGSGSPNGANFRREEEPLAYWTIFGVGTTALIFLLYVGFFRVS